MLVHPPQQRADDSTRMPAACHDGLPRAPHQTARPSCPGGVRGTDPRFDLLPQEPGAPQADRDLGGEHRAEWTEISGTPIRCTALAALCAPLTYQPLRLSLRHHLPAGGIGSRLAARALLLATPAEHVGFYAEGAARPWTIRSPSSTHATSHDWRVLPEVRAGGGRPASRTSRPPVTR